MVEGRGRRKQRLTILQRLVGAPARGNMYTRLSSKGSGNSNRYARIAGVVRACAHQAAQLVFTCLLAMSLDWVNVRVHHELAAREPKPRRQLRIQEQGELGEAEPRVSAL